MLWRHHRAGVQWNALATCGRRQEICCVDTAARGVSNLPGRPNRAQPPSEAEEGGEPC